MPMMSLPSFQDTIPTRSTATAKQYRPALSARFLEHRQTITPGCEPHGAILKQLRVDKELPKKKIQGRSAGKSRFMGPEGPSPY
jgi:hypothetical protein